MCLMLDQLLLEHSSRYCDIFMLNAACILRFPNFEIKCIDFFASNVIKTAFFALNVFDNFLYIAWKHIS